MATFAVGDVQGCAASLWRLLDVCGFDAERDELWLAGDLVNRGPDNLGVLRFAMGLGERAKVVLGNHDIHLLARAAGARPSNRKDTLDDVLRAPDRDALLHWLTARPLLHRTGNWVMTHAGLPPTWTVTRAEGYAREVEAFLQSEPGAGDYAQLFGNEPEAFNESLTGMARLRAVVNGFTRMRFCTADGALEFSAKEGPGSPPRGMRPWFDYPRPAEDAAVQMIFGHWAALEGRTGRAGLHALDTGCVWGGCLTALQLETGQRFEVACE